MSTNLWDETETESDSTHATGTATASTAGEQSPLAAAIEASSWSRADIEMALDVVQTVLLVVWVYHTYSND